MYSIYREYLKLACNLIALFVFVAALFTCQHSLLEQPICLDTMKLSVLATILPCAICASASVLIPDSLQDGLYEAHPYPYDASKNLIKRIDDNIADQRPSKRSRPIRGLKTWPPPGNLRNRDKLLQETIPLPDTRAFCRV